MKLLNYYFKQHIGIYLLSMFALLILSIFASQFINDILGTVHYNKGLENALHFSNDITLNEMEMYNEYIVKVDDNVVKNFLKKNGELYIYTSNDLLTAMHKDFTEHNVHVNSYETIKGYCGLYGVRHGLKMDSAYMIKVDADTIDEALVHEFGHYIDYVNGEVNKILYTENKILSETEEFKAIYEEEKNNSGLHEYYLNDNAAEYFAESYKQMRINTDNYYARCPKTCAYIDNAVRNMTY